MTEQIATDAGRSRADLAKLLLRSDYDPGEAGVLAEAAGVSVGDLRELERAAAALAKHLPMIGNVNAARAAVEKAEAARDRFWEGSLLAQIESEEKRLDELKAAVVTARQAFGDSESATAAVCSLVVDFPSLGEQLDLPRDLRPLVNRVRTIRERDRAHRRVGESRAELAAAQERLKRFEADNFNRDPREPESMTAVEQIKAHRQTLQTRAAVAQGRVRAAEKALAKAEKTVAKAK